MEMPERDAKCGSMQLPLARSMIPGFCSKCKGWLGSEQPNDHESPPEKLDQWMAEETRSLFRALNEGICKPSLGTLRQNLRFLINLNFSGRVSGLARAASIHHSSMLDILNGGARPGFDTLLRLSIATKMPLTQLVSQKPEILVSSFGSTEQVNHVSIPRRKCRRYNWAAIHKGLSKLQPPNVGISLHAFCRSQGADPGYVSKRFPQLAASAVKEFRLMVSKRHAERVQKEEGLFRSLIQDLLSVGAWPSHRKLRRGLPRSGFLRNPKLAVIRKQMLGLAPHGPWKTSVF